MTRIDPKICDHDWEEIWTSGNQYFTCVICGARSPEPALLGPYDPRRTPR